MFSKPIKCGIKLVTVTHFKDKITKVIRLLVTESQKSEPTYLNWKIKENNYGVLVVIA